MRRLLPGLILLASACALTIALSSSDRKTSSSSFHAEPPLSKPVTPYDTIRTDLADYAWPTDAGHIVTSCFGEYRRTHFHGGIDIQYLLPQKTPDVVTAEAHRVARILCEEGGYVLSPSHNIQLDTPTENIFAMYRAEARRLSREA